MVNREREKREGNNGIEMEKWEKYFRKQLRGVEEKVMRGERGETEAEEGEEEIRKEEVVLTLKKFKDGKAVREDGILAKVWKYGEEKIKD